MRRRDCLKVLGATTASMTMSNLWTSPLQRQASTLSSPWLNHLYLAGGPDFRQLMVPEYHSNVQSYGHQFWTNRLAAWGVSQMSQMEAIWNQMHWVEHGGQRFGFHPQATWLADQFKAGNVAIVNNVMGSRSRNHELATRVMEVGDVDLEAGDRQRSGWGGRLAKEMGENVLSLTSRVRQFCYGPSSLDPNLYDNANVISARNMRQFGLYSPERLETQPLHKGYKEVMTRSLSQYYKAKGLELSDASPYKVLTQHHEVLSEQGDRVRERLAGFEQDAELLALKDGGNALNNRGFAQQCLNLVDASVCKDLLNSSVVSLEYGGWDSHRDQNARLNDRFSDIFSNSGGLAQAQRVMSLVAPQVEEQAVTMITGEFGRQLQANGDFGTDHGRGNSLLLIGKKVNGGIYGNMFPESELDKLGKRGADIDGLTSVEPVLSKICDWLKPDSGIKVIPKAAQRELESAEVLSFL